MCILNLVTIMLSKRKSLLDPNKRYLQIALNNTLEEAFKIIEQLPSSDRIIIEAGTPLIKKYGEEGISQVKQWYQMHLNGESLVNNSHSEPLSLYSFFKASFRKNTPPKKLEIGKYQAYVVADLKIMDRGETEVDIAVSGGANAAIALGSAPAETLNAFIAKCDVNGIDSMIDMMNVDYPLAVLRSLKVLPTVVILHRGVDEERFNKEKQIPLHEIRRIKGNYDLMISIAGGDTIREVQRSVFNDADIVIAWKGFYQSSEQTGDLAEQFLKIIK